MKPSSFRSLLPATTSYLHMSSVLCCRAEYSKQSLLSLIKGRLVGCPNLKSQLEDIFSEQDLKPLGQKEEEGEETSPHYLYTTLAHLPTDFSFIQVPASIEQREVTQLGAKRI